MIIECIFWNGASCWNKVKWEEVHGPNVPRRIKKSGLAYQRVCFDCKHKKLKKEKTNGTIRSTKSYNKGSEQLFGT